METKQKYRANYLGYDINKLNLIGQGLEGKAYLLPEDKVLKVFFNMDSCHSQIETLTKARDSRFFPTVYDYDNYSIIMSFVHGVTLSNYLRKNKIDKHLSIELVKLIDEFKRLNFTRLDIRLAHIFLQPDGTIKAIDPRGSYDIIQPYPNRVLTGLKEHGALKDFYNYIKEYYPHYYKYWSRKV